MFFLQTFMIVCREMRIRWDSTIDELKEKSRSPNVDSIGYQKMDSGCQTDVIYLEFNLFHYKYILS